MSVIVCAPSKKRPHYKQAYIDALEIQQLVVDDAKNEECTRKERCMLARAFKELEELKLRLRMKGPPKPVDPAELDRAKAKRNAPAQGFTEAPGETKQGAKSKVQKPADTGEMK